MNFLFRKPHSDENVGYQANLAIAIAALASRLVTEVRTRVVHPDGRGENVAEHSFMLIKVATALAETYYPELNAGLVALYASLHDDVEAYVGDTPTDTVARHDAEEKKRRESAGLRQLMSEYEKVAPAYVRHAKEYEDQQIAEARFVRVVDKIMVELIHIPNEGAVLRSYYTADTARKATRQNAARLKAQYPEFVQLVDVRSEIAHMLIERYISR